MRFLLSVLALVALGSTVNAKLMSASVGPITEDPVPSWGNPSTDSCATVGSCDSCQPGGPQYCYYKESGEATCCQGKPDMGHKDEEPHFGRPDEEPKLGHKDEEPAQGEAEAEAEEGTLVASVGPITENPIPKWGNPASDRCNTVGSCDSCQPAGPQYCYYKESGEATCCLANKKPAGGAEDSDVQQEQEQQQQEQEQEEGGLVASVGPITEDPIPKWGNPASDSCSSVGSCDSCQPAGPQYCYYKESGEATCCQGHPHAPAAAASSHRVVLNHVSPLSSDPAPPLPSSSLPLPSWSSPSDLCKRHRSCDLCLLQKKENVYCKYTDSGIPQCCMGTGPQ